MSAVSISLLACGKTESTSAPSGSASAQASAPVAEAASSSAPTGAEPVAAAEAADSPLPAPAPSGVPKSFKGGTKENIAGAVGLGCEATSLEGYLQLLCRKKSGTGGHPVRATIHDLNAPPVVEPNEREPGAQPTEGDAASNEAGPNEQGELVVVVPFSGDTKLDVGLEWTDNRYTLHVVGNQASLEWAASGIPHRRACQQVLDESKAVVKAAQNAEGEARLTTTEGAKYSRFGTCQPGGLGSWALALESLAGKGEGAARMHHVELEVIRVDLDGKRKSAPFGGLEVAPGGFEVTALQVYDYDDDGRVELIVPYEVKAAGAAPATWPSPIWSFSDEGITAYSKAPNLGGGIGIEQLDFDMRPDFSTYAAYVAYFGADCGLKTCPPRLTGPKLFWHSQPDGSFADRNEAAKSALKRASCQSKPSAIVVEAGGSLNAAQTAKNVVCSRAFGVTSETVVAELTAKHAALCGEAATCPLETTLQAWAKLEVPFELAATVAKK
jgi:hypothetical protein